MTKDQLNTDMKQMKIQVLRYKLWIIGLLMVSTCAFAQSSNSQTVTAVAPSTSFQSTSTMTGSGSAYSSNPQLNADGTATYNGASHAPVRAISGPHRAGAISGDDEDLPIGDGILPLLLMAMACAVVIVARLKIRSAKQP